MHHFILSLPLIKFRLLKYSRIHHFISLYKKSCRSSLRNQKKIDLLNFFSPTHLVLAKVLFTACGRCFRASLTYADIFVPLPSHIKFIVNLSSLSSRFFWIIGIVPSHPHRRRFFVRLTPMAKCNFKHNIMVSIRSASCIHCLFVCGFACPLLFDPFS